MKRSLALAAVLVVVLSAAAFAGVQEFAKFTIDVADGWTATENQGTIIISKSDNTVKLSISVASIAETGVQTKPEVMELFVS
ncbi:MAG: hypothetical protein IJL18_00340, partial [Synergistaceae bacterium]|nr:hypothetical protein [Synergistaceae bacterium]